MENIFVESDKSFYHGFILSEQEFRRIIDTIVQQLKKSINETEPLLSYELKFENGVIAKTTSIDEIFSVENSGSGEIIRIKIVGEIGSEENYHKIELSFRNSTSENESSNIPINHIIKGKSKDWVFVTSSLIEERIKKIKKVNLVTKATSSKRGVADFILMPFMLLILIGTVATTIYLEKDNYIEEIETKWKAKEITDPIEVLLIFEKQKSALKDLEPMKYVLVGAFGLMVIFLFARYFFLKFYPSYNFCWGDYLEKFNKKGKFRKGFMTIFIIGILVSIIGGLIANNIG